MDAAATRKLLGLGLAAAAAVGAELCFCRPSLDWTAGPRAVGPALKKDLTGAVVGRRGEEVEMVFMFLSSLRKPGPCGFGSAAAVVRLLASTRRGLAGAEVRLEECIVGKAGLRLRLSVISVAMETCIGFSIYRLEGSEP